MKNSSIKPQRVFVVGSEWLYYNIYIGPQTSDKFLTSIVSPLTNSLIDDGVINKWFYIRYKDEAGLHLRVRFHLINTNYVNEVIARFHDLIMPFIENKLISNITINTYKRELERYGISTIEEFESLFFINSKLILDIIKLTEDDQKSRWLYGMKSIDRFLDGWNFTIEQKKQLLESLKISFGKEFGVDKEIRKQLSKKYRDNRSEIDAIINNENEDLDLLLKSFHEECKIHINNISLKLKSENRFESYYINDLLSSYIHMLSNRLFQSKQRLNEWVLYDLLYEYYYSKQARITSELKKKTIAISNY
ncbi:hypothetical protein LPB248_12970 [Flavobacterium sp. LPB0248]|uniref:thiopeptide-type bacteriocin biosynthesis protein n=1 Tax=Flavobacterium sp. LPB0248 TaxID=2614441 RepID=UPI0015A5D745|nr:thiopeptide-type bacteriocin biosynthesis protein [Flavobacterium sp. LPB0248]QLC67178.1 hypothetical protein LPB248_12970 [Flavobacterium sp. LPB0248]